MKGDISVFEGHRGPGSATLRWQWTVRLDDDEAGECIGGFAADREDAERQAAAAFAEHVSPSFDPSNPSAGTSFIWDQGGHVQRVLEVGSRVTVTTQVSRAFFAAHARAVPSVVAR